MVVGTPSRVLAHLQAQTLTLRDSLEVLVMDEADLLFSFGFEEDLKSLLWCVCSGFQSVGQDGSGCGACDLRWWCWEACGLCLPGANSLRSRGGKKFFSHGCTEVLVLVAGKGLAVLVVLPWS